MKQQKFASPHAFNLHLFALHPFASLRLCARPKFLGKVALPLLAVLAIGLVGCARETATTTVHANGSWTRKAVYSISEADNPKGQKPTKQLGLRDVFTPPSGQGWKVVQTRTGEKPPQIVVTAVKEVGATETIVGDLTVKNVPGKGQLPSRVVNTATVQPAGAGRLRYTETFHWIGARPNVEKDMAPLVRQSVKKALPKAFASEADVRALSARLERSLWSTLFSPPEPLLLDFYANLVPIPGLSDPDERLSVLTRRMGPGIEASLSETFGARMPQEQRHQTAVRLARQITEDTGAEAGKGDKMGGTTGKSPSTDSATESFGGMYPAAITVSVKLPGRVVETNGLVDELAGEVYWTLYPQAALEKDITLRAVFESRGMQQASIK